MTDVDPQWHVTGEQQPPVPASPVQSEKQPSGTVSRLPGAIAGILMAVGIGFTAFHGSQDLKGEVVPSDSPVEIRITDEGLIPPTITATVGQTIAWMNETEVPHIFQSDDLLVQDGTKLYTSAINPGTRVTFVLGASVPGTYTYASLVDPSVQGTVQIAAALPPTQPSSALSSAKASAGSIASSTRSASASSIVPVSQDALIPYNPYSVNSRKVHPYDENGNPRPVTSATSSRRAVATTKPATGTTSSSRSSKAAVLHAGAPSMPETGPELWIVLAGSIGALTWFTRRHFPL